MTTEFSAIVRTNNCRNCASHNVDPKELGVLVLGLEEVCSYCGHKLADSQTYLPTIVNTVLRSLVRHGMFHVEVKLPNGLNGNLVRLFTQEPDDTIITLDMVWQRFAAIKENPPRPFVRASVPCALPDAVLAAADIISRLKVRTYVFDSGELQQDRLVSFEMADVRESRKLLRFYVYWRLKDNQGYEGVRFEISWTPSAKANARIPTPEELALDKRDETCGDELQIRADAADLRQVAVAALQKQKGGTTVSLLRPNTGMPYDIAAVNQVVEELRQSRWVCDIGGPGAVVKGYYMHINPIPRS